MTEVDIEMTEHRSKNTLGRSVPIKTKTDVEEDGTSEDGSPRPVCSRIMILSLGVCSYLSYLENPVTDACTFTPCIS